MSWSLRVLRCYIRIGLIRKSQFRWEFLNQVVMDVCFYLSFILTFRILYGLDSGGALMLGGWTYAEMRVYLGMAFVSDALMMTFLGQQWHFGADLKDGRLDPFRVRPGSTAFLYFFQRFSPEGLTNLVMASGWLGYALTRAVAAGHTEWLTIAWTLPVSIIVIAWCQVFLTIAYNVIELWVVHSGVGHLASQILTKTGEAPLEVYPAPMKRFLQFVLPVAGVSWYPASFVLGRMSPLFAALYPVVLIGFGAAVALLFRRGLRRYESALG